MNDIIASAANAIAAVFDAIAGDRGAITGEQYIAYTKARDAILTVHGLTLKDYLTWCEDQEAAG